MKVANKELKVAYKDININDVEDLHEDMTDLLEDADEINEVLGQAYGVPDDLDESDLMDGKTLYVRGRYSPNFVGRTRCAR